ncbi:MAG: GNAT family N-acetyltransferase [Alphaproteobacteria bacterium]|nr:GNAT family N-acetyltransferase [Alphaproteobacteria bacterium]
MDGADRLTLRVVDRLAKVPAAAWDACAGDHPFVVHAFLQALEESGSATAETGWLPQHLLLEDGDGRLVGAAPLYVKSHSYGEYVFDHGWAEAYERAGGRYYPKLQVAVPFTPVPGPRLLLRPESGGDAMRLLIAGLLEVAKRTEMSSLHVTFPTAVECDALVEAGFLRRIGRQFHWENQNYRSFDDFLSALNARKRKQIKRERRDANAAVEIELLSGGDLKPRHWDAFFRFYTSTSDRKWGSPYLTREFFDLLGERMADRVLLVMAKNDGRYVAGALNLIGPDTLYGRNWGCIGDFPFLHFEACYYRAVEFAIARGLKRVEAGAQGPHKIQRGYLPQPTYSAHWIRDPGFRRAVADFLRREAVMVENEMDEMEQGLSPFRREGHGP